MINSPNGSAASRTARTPTERSRGLTARLEAQLITPKMRAALEGQAAALEVPVAALVRRVLAEALGVPADDTYEEKA